MNKKDLDEVLYSSEEDLKITKIARSNKFSLYIVLASCLFIIVILASTMSIVNYVNSKKEENIVAKKEIDKDNQVIISNNGIVDKNVTEDVLDSKGEYSFICEDSIEFLRNKDTLKEDTIYYSVKYDIINNSFKSNIIPTNDSEALVRFFYSYDRENWTYVNNVISSEQKNLNPLMGSYFDIAGLTNNLKVATNYELTSNPGESKIVYWRAETTIRSNFKKNFNGNIKANFYITVE